MIETCAYHECKEPIWKDGLCQFHYHYVRIQNIVGPRWVINETTGIRFKK